MSSQYRRANEDPERFEDEGKELVTGGGSQSEQDDWVAWVRRTNSRSDQEGRRIPCGAWVTLNLIVCILAVAALLSIHWKGSHTAFDLRYVDLGRPNETAAAGDKPPLMDYPEIDDTAAAPAVPMATVEAANPAEDETSLPATPIEEETTIPLAEENSPTPEVTVPPTEESQEEQEETPAVSNEITHAYMRAHEAIVAHQVETFKSGVGILLNFVISHHGGTTVRWEFQDILKCPSFVCVTPTEDDWVREDYPYERPWFANETSKNVYVVRQSFRMIMWGFTQPPASPPYIQDTTWETPGMVSLLVVREPISRSLAGDATMSAKYPNIHDPNAVATEEEWWEFAREPYHTNNYALRVLSDESSCCDGADTPRHYLDKAKELVKRFTFILDIRCLEHGLVEVGKILGIRPAHYWYSEDKMHDHTPAVDRIPYPEVREFLVEKNKLDIELYEFAKSLALLDCDAVYAAEAAKQEEIEQAEEVAADAEEPAPAAEGPLP